MHMPCKPSPSKLLQPYCYDKYGRRLYGYRPTAREMGAEARKWRRPLPPGTRAPRKSLEDRVLETASTKARKSKQFDTKSATFFHVQGQSWESKGFAKIDEEEVARMRADCPLSEIELQEDYMRLEEEKRNNNEMTEQLRQYFYQIDETRRETRSARKRAKDQAAEDIEDLTKRNEAKRLQVLHKALHIKYAQDERVQVATRAINGARCNAVLRQQMKDRELMERAQMECEKKQLIKDWEYNVSKWGTIEQRDKQELNKRLEFNAEVRKQMTDRENLRYLAEDQRRMDAEEMHKAIDVYKRSQKELKLQRSKRKMAYHEELQYYIRANKDFRHMMCLQEQRDELRANKYIIDKEHKLREERKVKAAQAAEEQRRRDVLYAIQQKALDAKTNQDEMRLISESEKVERKYREEERAATEKVMRAAEDLRQSHREHQYKLNCMRACYNLQHQREHKEILKERAEYQKQLQREKEELATKKRELLDAVGRQINDQELNRRRIMDEEQVRNDHERAMKALHQKEIDMVIGVKLNELQSTGLLPVAEVQMLSGRLAHRNQKLSRK